MSGETYNTFCPRCKNPKNLVLDFYPSKQTISGREYVCKACNSEKGRAYRKKETPSVEKLETRRANSRAWYASHKSYWPDRLAKNPSAKVATRMRTRVCNAIKRNFVSGSKSLPTEKLIGCSFLQLRAHLEKSFTKEMTWENYGPVWHVDHIRPCATFDLTDPMEQLKCFNFSNLQPLSALENQKKGSFYAY